MSDPVTPAYELEIESRGDGRFRARGRHPNGPRASHDFEFPLAQPGGEADLLQTDGATLSEGGLEAAARFGRGLRDRVLGGGLLEHIESSLSLPGNGGHLQLLLNLSEAPDLASVPWEYLWYPRRGVDLPWFAGSPPLTVLRWMPQPDEARPVPTDAPSRMLVVISDPGGREKLDGDVEWDVIRDALYGHDQTRMSKNLIVERLEVPTVRELDKRLGEKEFHILHFVGHGELDEKRGLGTLIFEDSPADEALGAPLDARRIQFLLGNRPTLRLVVLNACDGARAIAGNLWSGVAQSLIQAGIPVVVAMQAAIYDDTATALADTFYRGLARGLPIDRALSEARRTVAMIDDHEGRRPNDPTDEAPVGKPAEWGVPVLYTRSADCRLIDRAAFDAPEDLERRNFMVDTRLDLGLKAVERRDPDAAERYLKLITGRLGGHKYDLVEDGIRLLRRPPPSETSSAQLVTRSALDPFDALLDAIRRGLVVPVLGRSESMQRAEGDRPFSLGDLPSDAELARYLYKKLFDAETPDQDLAWVTQSIDLMRDRGVLDQEVDAVFGRVSQPPGLHRLLARLAALPRYEGSEPALPLILTTSYDGMLERAFDEAKVEYDLVWYDARSWTSEVEPQTLWWHRPLNERPRPVRKPESYTGFNLTVRTTIVRLVGMIGDASLGNYGYLITEDDHLPRLPKGWELRKLPQRLRGFCTETRIRLLFLGYSLREWEQRLLIRSVFGGNGPQRPRYVQSDVDELTQKLWGQLNAERLPASVEQFVSTMTGLLREVTVP